MSKAKQQTITLQLDEELCHAAEKIFKARGLSFEDAINLFLLQSVQMREYPLLVPPNLRAQVLDKEPAE